MLNRQKIMNSGLKGLTEKYLNDNFEILFRKLGGGRLEYTDLNIQTQNAINTQWIPFTITENVKEGGDIEGKFYIPDNTEIKDVKLSIDTEASTYTLSNNVINISINDENIDIPSVMSTDSTECNISVKSPCKTGWNTLKVIGLGAGKKTIYGISEVVIKA